MRILYYFRELPTPMYWWQHRHFIDELNLSGHLLETFNPLDYSCVDDACEAVLNKIKHGVGYDLFITCVDQKWIKRSTIEEIKKMGLPTCLICWDNLEVPYKHKDIASAFDIVWLTSQETQYLFKQWGCSNILFLPYAANPHNFKPALTNVLINKVGFIGSPYGSRANKLNELLDAGIPCAVYSDSLFNKGYNTSVGGKKKMNLWDITIKASRYMRFSIGRQVLYSTIKNKLSFQKGLNTESCNLQKEMSVSDEDMQRLYSSFSISLNISELRDTYILCRPIPKIHLRTFEIPMCGGLQFTSYNSEIADYFEEDKEIILYRTKEEMIDKARFYLDEKNDTIIQNIKKAARLRAERDHTWINRFNIVFKTIFQ